MRVLPELRLPLQNSPQKKQQYLPPEVVAVTVAFERQADSGNAALSVLAWEDSDSLTFRPSSSCPRQQTGQQALILSLEKTCLSYGTCYGQKCGINAAQYFQGFCNKDFCSSLLSNKDSEFKALLATFSSPQRRAASAWCLSLACNLHPTFEKLFHPSKRPVC